MATRPTVGSRIRSRRLQQKLSQQDAAAKAGMHPSEWSRIEAGKRNNLQMVTLTRIAQALNVSVFALMPKG